jgi:hypothetical protein
VRSIACQGGEDNDNGGRPNQGRNKSQQTTRKTKPPSTDEKAACVARPRFTKSSKQNVQLKRLMRREEKKKAYLGVSRRKGVDLFFGKGRCSSPERDVRGELGRRVEMTPPLRWWACLDRGVNEERATVLLQHLHGRKRFLRPHHPNRTTFSRSNVSWLPPRPQPQHYGSQRLTNERGIEQCKCSLFLRLLRALSVLLRLAANLFVLCGSQLYLLCGAKPCIFSLRPGKSETKGRQTSMLNHMQSHLPVCHYKKARGCAHVMKPCTKFLLTYMPFRPPSVGTKRFHRFDMWDPRMEMTILPLPFTCVLPCVHVLSRAPAVARAELAPASRGCPGRSSRRRPWLPRLRPGRNSLPPSVAAARPGTGGPRARGSSRERRGPRLKMTSTLAPPTGAAGGHIPREARPARPRDRGECRATSAGGRRGLSPWCDESKLGSEFIGAARAPTRDPAASSWRGI